MRDPSPYAGQTVRLRAEAAELGGHRAEVADWYDRVGNGVSWRDNPGDPRAAGYSVRRGLGGLPDDDDVLYARVDGMGQLVHVTEIEGAVTPEAKPIGSSPTPVASSEIGEPCPACRRALAEGDMVAVVPLGPGPNPAARLNARSGYPFDAVTVELHWACRTGDESYQKAEG
jgi:hypothetical protein